MKIRAVNIWIIFNNEFGKGLMCDTLGARGKGRLEFLESLEGGRGKSPCMGEGVSERRVILPAMVVRLPFF